MRILILFLLLISSVWCNEFFLSSDVVLQANWQSNGLLKYSFCVAPKKPTKILDDITSIRIIHIHEEHKAFDQVYPLCSSNKTCIQKGTRCIEGVFNNLPLKYEPRTTSTFMKLHLLAAETKGRKQSFEERTRYTLIEEKSV